MPNNIVFSNPGAALVQWGNGAATPYLTLSGLPSTGTVGVAVSGLVTNPSAATATWTVSSSPADAIITPSSGTLAPGVAVAFTLTALASGLKNVQLTSTTPNTIISGSPHSFTAASVAPPPPPPAPAASALTLSMASTGTTGSATLVTVTPNAAIGATGTATLAVSGGGTLGTSTLNFTAGSSAAQSTTLTRTTDGTTTLTMTNNMGLSNIGSPASYGSTSAASTGTPQPFTLDSASSGVLPFAIGYAMSQGHVPAGQGLSFAGATAKLTVLSSWPDGSARHGIIAGTYTSAGSAVTVTPTVATVTAGTALTGAAVQTAMGANTAVFDAGAFGSATFSGADFATPFVTHAATDTFIEAIYRKQIGTDAHLVAWLSLRVWASGQVEALPWIENGYLTVAGPTNKSATYSFTLGGTSRFSAAIDIPNHCRTPLVSGSALSHWLGTDPEVTPTHDRAYLQATRLVPSYRATVSPSSATVTALPSTYTPLQQGGFPAGMGSAGYHPSIGLLPEWDVLALTTTANVSAAIQRNAYSAGRYGIHFRDESTNRPVNFATHTTLVIDGSSGVSGTGASSTGNYTPTASGSANTYASSHAPALGFMAYLLTGRFYHLETVQFQAAIHYLKNSDTNREGASGIMRTDVGANTTRGAAWALRTLAHAAIITPDSDALKTPLHNSLAANVDWNHAKYVAQANNPQGWVHPYSDYTTSGDNQFFEASWMQDFWTASLGYAKAMQPTLSTAAQARLDELFDWKAKSVTGRLGSVGASEYLYRDAAPFVVSVAPDDSPDFNTGTGSWHPSWGPVWTATQVQNTTGAKEPGDGTLRGGNIPDATSYWGNFLPAVAYAVEHGAQGAAAGFLRLASASNWATLQSNFDANPVWGVKPPTDPALPSWLPSAGQWAALSSSTLNTSGAGWTGTSPGGTGTYETIVTAWGGGVVNTKGVWRSGAFVRGTFLVIFGGGHGDYGGNELYAFGPMENDAPTWSRINSPTIPAPQNVTRSGAYPVSRHTYDTLVYLPEQNKMVCIGAPGYYSVGSAFNSGDIFDFDVDPDSGTPWASLDTGFPAFNGGGTGTIDLMSWYDPTTGKAWGIGKGNSQRIGAYDPIAGSWSSSAIDNPNGPNGKGKAGFSPGDGIAAFLTDAGAVRACDIRTSPAMFTPTVTGTGPGTACSVEWDEENGRFVAWSGTGATLYFLTPGANPYSGGDSWAWTSATPGAGATPANQVSNGTYGRMRIVELGSARGVLLMPAHNQPVYFYRF